MRQKHKHAEAGDHQEAGSQLAKLAGPEKEPLETVGQTQDIPVTLERSTTTWAISTKVLNTIRGEDIIGWTWVQPRREGAWRTIKPPG
jgi:hypothetical protein